MTNVVTLELTGDESSLETAIASATRQFQQLDTQAATTATNTEQAGSKMDRVAERADNLATRTGTLAGGIGAVAGGMALLGVEADSAAGKIVGGLSVAIGTLSGVMDIVAIATTSSTVASIGHKIATVAGTVATGAQTAAQWALNAAMTANPIGLIIAAIVALVAIVVLIATKTTWFQDIWRITWTGVKSLASGFVDFFKSIPHLIETAFSGLVDIILWPYKTAFNLVADAWNNTIGKLSWTVPSWVPFIGGNTISAPKLPKFHSGGVIGGGPEGAEVAIIARVGERVETREQQAADGPSVTYHITVNGNKFRDGTDFEEWLDELRNDGRGGGEVVE